MKTTGLELLEQKIRKAADLIRTLREERASLEKRNEALQAELAATPDEDLGSEVERMREERLEILTRVDRMLALLDEADGSAEETGLLAAVDGME